MAVKSALSPAKLIASERDHRTRPRSRAGRFPDCSLPSSQLQPAPGKDDHPWAKRLGPLGPLAIFSSQGQVLPECPAQLKFLFSFVAFFGLYWALWGPKFGIGFAVLILIHEMGHYIDIKRRGLPADMPYFARLWGLRALASAGRVSRNSGRGRPRWAAGRIPSSASMRRRVVADWQARFGRRWPGPAPSSNLLNLIRLPSSTEGTLRKPEQGRTHRLAGGLSSAVAAAGRECLSSWPSAQATKPSSPGLPRLSQPQDDGLFHRGVGGARPAVECCCPLMASSGA